MDKQQIVEQAKAIQPWIVGLRRQLHQHPELMYEEFETSKLVQSTLDELGIEYQKDIAVTGVLGTVGNGNGPCVALARWHRHYVS